METLKLKSSCGNTISVDNSTLFGGASLFIEINTDDEGNELPKPHKSIEVVLRNRQVWELSNALMQLVDFQVPE